MTQQAFISHTTIELHKFLAFFFYSIRTDMYYKSSLVGKDPQITNSNQMFHSTNLSTKSVIILNTIIENITTNVKFTFYRSHGFSDITTRLVYIIYSL